jgi:hypothetical protein
MIDCPKCGYNNIAGPRYGRDTWGYEHLYYTCLKCGYEEARPTLDDPMRALKGEK